MKNATPVLDASGRCEARGDLIASKSAVVFSLWLFLTFRLRPLLNVISLRFFFEHIHAAIILKDKMRANEDVMIVDDEVVLVPYR